MPTIYRKTMTLKDFLSQNDRFAANSGCLLKEVREGYARAELVVTSEHLNAGGVCQGGAYFTLADIALAAVMNSRGTLTFGIENNIVFLQSAKVGDTLIAEATEVFNHHKIPYRRLGIICMMAVYWISQPIAEAPSTAAEAPSRPLTRN